jgi:bifunctional UDP-N-acetylglucosamine pyrophosphorylase/glucosamine-1-phosphate N-acetyltransferase
MQAIILGAGKSSRMNPLGDKVLLPFLGKTLLEHQIEKLMNIGIYNIIIAGNSLNLDFLQSLCSQLEKKHALSFSFAIQEDFSDGIKGALTQCEKLISEEFIIMNSNDIVENSLFENLLKAKDNNKVDAIVCGKHMENYFPGGYISLDENNFLTGIVEKPGEGNEPSKLVNILIHYYKDHKDFFTHLQKSTIISEKDGYEVAVREYGKERNIFVLEYLGIWQAIKYPWHILDAQNIFLENMKPYISSSAYIAKTAVITGNVYIDDEAHIDDFAVISGPSYIGKKVRIGQYSHIRNSHIERESVIGTKSEIVRSYIKNNVFTHNAYVGDSLIEEHCLLGNGVSFANLRFDEQDITVEIKGEKINSKRKKLGGIIGSYTRIGSNSTLLPGIKIGSHCCISPQSLVSQNVENDIFLCTTSVQKKKMNTIERIMNT